MKTSKQKRKIQVLTEQDMAKMDAKRKPRDFFAFVKAMEAEISGSSAQTDSLSRESGKRQETALESLESAFAKGGSAE